MERSDFTRTISNALDSVVKIERPDGGIGSGLILDDGTIITCEHVIRGARSLQIKFHDGRKVNAEVVAADSNFDLAALRPKFPTGIDFSHNLNTGAHLAKVDVELGQQLKAIGHPLNLEWAVTGGSFNAKREVGEISRLGIDLKTPLLQVDVVINQGNSGGPLIDLEGHVVGIATAIIDPSKAQTMGFAIPIETITRFREKLGPNISSAKALVLYSCQHHHPVGQTWCEITGKQISIIGEMPQEVTQGDRGDVLYSCRHRHPAGLSYCPTTGKPVHVVVDSSIQTTGIGASGTTVRYSCGHEHPRGLSYCPDLGRPIKPISF